jgi:hypothetical protein
MTPERSNDFSYVPLAFLLLRFLPNKYILPTPILARLRLRPTVPHIERFLLQVITGLPRGPRAGASSPLKPRFIQCPSALEEMLRACAGVLCLC